MALPVFQMNGIGNAILVADLRDRSERVTGSLAARVAAQPGFAFDQFMVVLPPRRAGTDAFVEIFNNDGSEAGACGNGMRCVSWVMLQGTDGTDLLAETKAGLLPCVKVGSERFSVDMGPPKLGWEDIPLREAAEDTRSVALPDPPTLSGADLSRFSAVSMGNPHAVFFVPDAASVDLATVGAAIETAPIFPDRANISFATVLGRDAIELRTWERGAGATLACGSAACATLVAAVRAGLCDRSAVVHQRGGSLAIEWREQDGHVVMTGPVVLERETVLPDALLADAA